MLDLERRVADEARGIHPGRSLLLTVAAFFFLLGWLAAKLCIGIGLVFSWSLAGIRVGWQDAYRSGRRLGTP